MGTRALTISPVQAYLESLYAELLEMEGGEVASYIPELTKADPGWLGIALVTVDGHVYQVGDSRQQFTVQSISKAIIYGLALEDQGLDAVLAKVGVEPSGEAFNSISLEEGTGRPFNPMINAGAIATTGLVNEKPGEQRLQRLLDTFGRYTGRAMAVDETVYRSESDTGHRNRAISHLLLGHGILEREPEDVLDLYFRQCSILVSARDLAMMGACLANSGVNPVTGVVALNSRYADKVLSVMSTCGMYDYSGGWIFNVGMPAKSGVGGGIMAVLPGQFGLGVFSPPLDAKGNSVRGIEACKRISNDFSLHLFKVANATSASVIRHSYDCARVRSGRPLGPAARAVLDTSGHQIRVYELQGELMFGSAESVTLRMFEDLDRARYLIVDLKRVVGLDQASIGLLLRLCERAAEDAKVVLFTETRHLYGLRRRLAKALAAKQDPDWLRFDATSHALEWCESQLIDAQGRDGARRGDLCDQYLCAGMSKEEIACLRAAGKERTFRAEETVIRIGEIAESLFFLLQGEAEVWLAPDADAQPAGHGRLRLTTLGPGMVFGEIGLLSGQLRTANVTALTDLSCLEVHLEDLSLKTRNRMLVNMASYFADMLRQRAELMQHLA